MTAPLAALTVARWPDSDVNITQGNTDTEGGQLLVEVNAGSWGAAYGSFVEFVEPGSLEGSSLTVELVAPGENGNTQTTQTRIELHTGTPHGESLLFEVNGATLHAGYRVGVNELAQWVAVRPYSALAHRWLRFRERAGFVLWEASPDGFDWTELGGWPTGFALDELTLRLEAGFWGPPEGEVGWLPLAPATFGPINPSFGLPDDPLTIIASDSAAPNIAVDVLPVGGIGTFVVDESEVGGDDVLGWGAGGDAWANVVCDVTRVRIRRGATRLQGALTRTEAGEAVVELIDTDRRFDPTVNLDAIHPGTRFRVRAWGAGWSEVLMTGRIDDDLTVQYLKTGAPRVRFTAVDVVGVLARYASAGYPEPGIGAGDDLLERVERVVAEVGRPAGTIGYDTDPGYSVTLAPTTLARGWETISDAADAELGRVWVTRHDRILVRARGSALSGPVRGMLSDWHGETVEGGPHCCYDDATVRVGTEMLTNRAIAARDVAVGDVSALVQVDDTVSQARYDTIATVDRRQLPLQYDGQLEPWARHLVAQGATPELRVDSVSLAPAGAPEAWQAVAATDVGDRWAFRLHPELGPTVLRTLGVLGITHEITPESWAVELITVDAPTPTEGNPSGWFIVGDSELGSGDVLFPRGAVTEWDPVGA